VKVRHNFCKKNLCEQILHDFTEVQKDAFFRLEYFGSIW